MSHLAGRFLRLSIKSILLSAVIVVYSGCSDVKFANTPGSQLDTLGSGGSTGGSGPGGGKAPGCTIQTTTQALRILFMVDNSGSTATTDPNDQHRVATVQTFLNNYGSKTTLTYAYSYFSVQTETYDMTSASFVPNPAVVFGNATEASNALNAFEMIPPGGNTAYMAAFSSLQSFISADATANPSEKYVVIFMSDGQPTDLGGTANQEISGITNLVNSLLAAAGSGRITISSVFFGDSSDTQSVDNLQTMAQLGGGQFVNTNVTSDVSIDNLITVPGNNCKP